MQLGWHINRGGDINFGFLFRSGTVPQNTTLRVWRHKGDPYLPCFKHAGHPKETCMDKKLKKKRTEPRKKTTKKVNFLAGFACIFIWGPESKWSKILDKGSQNDALPVPWKLRFFSLFSVFYSFKYNSTIADVRFFSQTIFTSTITTSTSFSMYPNDSHPKHDILSKRGVPASSLGNREALWSERLSPCPEMRCEGKRRGRAIPRQNWK